ncbi:hypothetical protein AB0M54_39605 [Actinoplanes sp. NPDC051470]|uniref:hypothetical protein n=1 Tax=unclassified Actinoplanes TaxID=2626549 RepID=UPI00341D3FEA
MAIIRSFRASSQNVKRHSTDVDCEWAVVGGGDDRVLHLSTFGSDTRKSQPKSSQSIQLDRARAQELIDILVKAFPGISR